MPKAVKTGTVKTHVPESSFVSLLSGWVQQGVENFFATQRILVDLATRQNTGAVNFVRERLGDTTYCPTAVVSEVVGEGLTNFIEGQKLLLHLAKQQYEIVTTGVKERVAGFTPAVAVTDLVQRSFDTFVDMHAGIPEDRQQTDPHLAGGGKSAEELRAGRPGRGRPRQLRHLCPHPEEVSQRDHGGNQESDQR